MAQPPPKGPATLIVVLFVVMVASPPPAAIANPVLVKTPPIPVLLMNTPFAVIEMALTPPLATPTATPPGLLRMTSVSVSLLSVAVMLPVKTPVQLASPTNGAGVGGVHCASAGADMPSDEDASAEAARSQSFHANALGFCPVGDGRWTDATIASQAKVNRSPRGRMRLPFQP